MIRALLSKIGIWTKHVGPKTIMRNYLQLKIFTFSKWIVAEHDRVAKRCVGNERVYVGGLLLPEFISEMSSKTYSYWNVVSFCWRKIGHYRDHLGLSWVTSNWYESFLAREFDLLIDKHTRDYETFQLDEWKVMNGQLRLRLTADNLTSYGLLTVCD